MTNPIQTKVAETMSGQLDPESPSALVSDARAAEIRGELCAKHGALWLHYYGRAIEQELARVIGNVNPTLRPSYVQQWLRGHQDRAADELLEALKQ